MLIRAKILVTENGLELVGFKFMLCIQKSLSIALTFLDHCPRSGSILAEQSIEQEVETQGELG